MKTRLTGRFISVFIGVASVLGVTAFRPWQEATPVTTLSVPAVSMPQETGAAVAEHLQKRFDEEVKDCGSSTRLAVLCSGVLLRGTTWSNGFHSWIPNPATSAGGVSFSWLRKDSNFATPAYANGFIVYPYFYADDKPLDSLTVRCGYVVNAGTGSLPDKCRVPCQAQNIHTSAAWLAQYPSGYGCAFEVSPGTSDSSKAWMALVEIRKARNIFTWNEIMVAPWPQNLHERMPVEAFFFIANSAAGVANAKLDQQDFKTTAKRWVPVIRVTMATSIAGRATFTYNAADQAITN